MTARRGLKAHLHQLQDVRGILSSLKNLAYMEVSKLTPRIEAQREAVRLREEAASDFLAHFPAHRAETMESALAGKRLVVIGSERGFCGPFNRQLIDAISADDGELIAVGRKLGAQLGTGVPLPSAIDGAVMVEETDAVITELTSQIRVGTTAVDLLFHDDMGAVRRLSLLPPFRELEPPAHRHAFPPVLNLSPATFYAQMVEEYLFAGLHLALFSSLLTENQQRARHLEGAAHRLDERIGEFQRRDRHLRQEEITEEIEIILLNADRG